MKSAAISRFVMVAAIAALVVVGGSTGAWAETGPPPCPASPNFSTDFTSGQNCLTLNGNGPSFVLTGANNTAPTVLRLTPNSGNQVAAVWFNTPQTVQNGFTTTFQFKFTNPSVPPADGIAFVIQNTGLAAIGSPPNGGALGYGDSDSNPDPSTGQGIPKSLAIEFDTFINGWDSNNANHVAIQSCGQGRNTSHHGHACGGNGPSNSTLGFFPITSPIFSAGAQHSVTITYTPACSTCSPQTAANLDVILDNTDVTPGGVGVDLASIGLTSGTAFVGFTGATGGDDENQDILNWTFMPVSQSQVVTTGTTASFESPVPFEAGGSDYNARLNAGSPVTTQVTQVPIADQATCNQIVGATFPGAKCFVYQNVTVNGVLKNVPVMFEITCPQSPGGTCGTDSNPNYDALLGTDFHFDPLNNPGFADHPLTPFPGWLKGDGKVLGHPCAANPDGLALFQSNQIDSFQVLTGDPPGKTKGGSGGTGSCWVATYSQPDETLPAITITSPTNMSYPQGAVVPAVYTCSNPTSSKLPELPAAGNPVGPYLTAASCLQATGSETLPCTQTSSGLSCNGTVDTIAAGPHTFTVAAMDSGTNTSTQSVPYTVVAPADLRITKSALSKIPVNSNLTYVITVVNRNPNPNPASAVGVVVTDPLPLNTTFVSASGINNACSIVSGKLSCSITSVPCPRVGNTVTCQLGTVAPAATWFLNGVAIQITVGVKNVGVGNTIKNTATVTETNTDPNGGDNSASASTTVTAR